MGRPLREIVDAMHQYRMIEIELAQDELNSFHFGHDVVLTNPELNSAVSNLLSFWKGFPDLKEAMLSPLCEDRDTTNLVAFGAPTSVIWDDIMDVTRGQRALWTDSFYEPWRIQLNRALKSQLITGGQIRVADQLHPDSGSGDPDLVRERVSRGILEQRPQVVFLSVVTQGGMTLPCAEIVQDVIDYWAESGWFPLFIFDACQSYGRIVLSLDDSALAQARCAVIACLHKAMRGPKDMAFLVCTNGGWRLAFQTRLEEGARARKDLNLYSNSEGHHIELGTVDCARAIGAAKALIGMSARLADLYEDRILNTTRCFGESLDRTQWRIINGDVSSFASGIVLLQRLEQAPMHHGYMCRDLREFRPRVVCDEFQGKLRFAFDRTHSPEFGSDLARILNEYASQSPSA